MVGFPVLIGFAKLAGGFFIKAAIATAVATGAAVGITAFAETPVGKPIVGAVKTAGKTVGKVAKGIWGAAKKIPILGSVFRGIENFPRAFWSTAKKTPIVGRLCYKAEEWFYEKKAYFNKEFTKLRAIIAKIKSILVDLLFKVLKSLDKDTAENGKKAMSDIKKEKKALAKEKKKGRETPSRNKTKDISRGAPEGVKAQSKGKEQAMAAAQGARRKGPVVTTDIAQKINSAKGMAVPGGAGAAPVIAAGKGMGQKTINKTTGR